MPNINDVSDLELNVTLRRATSVQSVIGILLRELRYERDVHQASVADLLGISRIAYQNFESGHKSMEVSQLFKTLQYLATPASMFWGAFERYCLLLSSWGWSIAPNVALDDNDLIRIVHQFYYYYSPMDRPKENIMHGPAYSQDPDTPPPLPRIFEYIRDNPTNAQ